MRTFILLFIKCVFIVDFLWAQTILLDKPPKDKAKIFAPGIVSTLDKEHSPLSVAPDGMSIYWSFWASPVTDESIIQIAFVEMKNGKWGARQLAGFNNKSGSFYSCFWGNDKIIFRSLDVQDDFWLVKKQDKGWSDAELMGFNKFSTTTKAPYSVSKDGDIYFGDKYSEGAYETGIYVSRYQNNQHSKPELLPGHINTENLDWTPFIAPDDSYLVFSSNRPNGFGSTDIYFTFRNKENTWSNPINAGEKVNTELEERFPSISPDGRILFFLRDYDRTHQDFYWIDTEFIEELKPEALYRR